MTERTTDALLNISQDVRQMAENNVTQAKQAVEKCMREAEFASVHGEGRLRRHRGVRDRWFAKQQINARRLRAAACACKDLREMALLQQQVVQSLSARAMDLDGAAADDRQPRAVATAKSPRGKQLE